MTALLLFARFAAVNEFAFGSGLEGWAKENLPGVQLLDLDSGSDKSYATQLAEAAAQAPALALWVKSQSPDAPIGAAASLLEAWLRYDGAKLLVLEGENSRVEKMGLASSAPFCKGNNPEELKPHVLRFFEGLRG